MKFWFEYLRASYDLVLEAEKSTVVLKNDVEEYVVQLFARNFERTDIGTQAVAIQLLEAVQSKDKNRYQEVADECLLIHSYPLKQRRWPSTTYYVEMGVTAYGLAHCSVMEENFVPASRVLNGIFRKISIT